MSIEERYARTEERVVQVDELHFPFEQDDPLLYVGTKRGEVSVRMKAQPAYPHDVGLVRKLLAEVEEAFPLARPPVFHLPRFDSAYGVNGWTVHCYLYEEGQDEDGNFSEQPHCVLFGKAIPPHPAVTRSLVAHEYGHAVFRAVARAMYGGEHDAAERLASHYADIRSGPVFAQVRYERGKWHYHPEEVFADDFRVLIAEVEDEYWPHPNVPRPDNELWEWWYRFLPISREWRGEDGFLVRRKKGEGSK